MVGREDRPARAGREAAIRGDIFRVVSNPNLVENIWQNGLVGGTRTITGEEIRIIEEEFGYVYNELKYVYEKP